MHSRVLCNTGYVRLDIDVSDPELKWSGDKEDNVQKLSRKKTFKRAVDEIIRNLYFERNYSYRF